MKYAMNSQGNNAFSTNWAVRVVILAIVCIAPMISVAQASGDTIVRPVTASYALEIGSSHLNDTYLTPLRYNGWSAALTYERLQAMKFDPEHWIMRLDGRLSFGSTENTMGNATMWNINFRPSWSMLRRWDLKQGLGLAIGGNVGINLGALYLLHNGNNPVSLQASATAGVTAMATYATKLGKLPITLRYQPTMPLIGAFFSPDYDQLYYEIWLGNHSGLCHVAWPGNYFRLDNLLTADLHFGATTLRVGYRCELFSSKASGIVSNRAEHSFVIGVSTEWISLRSNSNRTPDARIISAM